MAREDMARDFHHDHRSSPGSAGARAGTVLEPTATAAAPTGSSLHSIVSVPADAPTSRRTSADVRPSTVPTGLASIDEHRAFPTEFECGIGVTAAGVGNGS